MASRKHEDCSDSVTTETTTVTGWFADVLIEHCLPQLEGNGMVTHDEVDSANNRLELFNSIFLSHCFEGNRPAIFRGTGSSRWHIVEEREEEKEGGGVLFTSASSSTPPPLGFDLPHLQSSLAPSSLLNLFSPKQIAPVVCEEEEDRCSSGGTCNQNAGVSVSDGEEDGRRSRPLPPKVYTSTTEEREGGEGEVEGDGSSTTDAMRLVDTISPRHVTRLGDFISFCTKASAGGGGDEGARLYLKDWHYLLERDEKERGKGKEGEEEEAEEEAKNNIRHINALYQCPAPLQLDWLNEYCLRRGGAVSSDDVEDTTLCDADDGKEEAEEKKDADSAPSISSSPPQTPSEFYSLKRRGATHMADQHQEEEGDQQLLAHHQPTQLNDLDLFGKQYRYRHRCVLENNEKNVKKKKKRGTPPTPPTLPLPINLSAPPPELAGDYRFVYIGQVGSTTPYHMDVFGSYSWSFNVKGVKRWRFYLPPEEGKERKEESSPSLSTAFFPPMPIYTENDASAADVDNIFHRRRFVEVIQKEGDLIFVPSQVFHCVENISSADENGSGDAGGDGIKTNDGSLKQSDAERPSPLVVSVNHNWFNRFNIVTHVVPLLCREAMASHASADAETRAAFRGGGAVPPFHALFKLEEVLALLEPFASGGDDDDDGDAHCPTTLKGHSALFELGASSPSSPFIASSCVCRQCSTSHHHLVADSQCDFAAPCRRRLFAFAVAADQWLSHVEFMLQCGGSWNLLSMRRLLCFIVDARRVALKNEKDNEEEEEKRDAVADSTTLTSSSLNSPALDIAAALKGIEMLDEVIVAILMDV